MKKIAAVFVLPLILFCNRSSAQYLLGGNGAKTDSTLPQVDFGAKIGANFQSISGNGMWQQNYNAGIAGGFFIGMHKKKIGVRIEILASTARYNARTLTDSFGVKADFRAIYLNVPVLFKYNFIPRLALVVGPQYSNLLSVKGITAFSGDAKSLFKQSELSGVIGLEGKLPKHISVGARYIYGFSDLNNAQQYSEKWTTSTIQAYLGYEIK